MRLVSVCPPIRFGRTPPPKALAIGNWPMAVCAAMSAVGQKGVSLFVVIGDSVLFAVWLCWLLLLLLFAGPLILVVLCANEGLLIFYSSSMINNHTSRSWPPETKSSL